jgi:hypothetical protein
MYVTYLLLNFVTMFPDGLGYFAPQKRFHINSKGKSSWCNVSSSKDKICTTELEYLLKKIIFNFKGLYHKKQNDKCKRTSSLKSSTVLQWKTSPLKSIILTVL